MRHLGSPKHHVWGNIYKLLGKPKKTLKKTPQSMVKNKL
jgi:hypothetical protein